MTSPAAGVRRHAVSVQTRRTLADCSPIAGRIVRIAALLGATFSFDHVAAILRDSPSMLLDALEELMRAGLIVEAHDDLALRDDLFRRAVIDTVPGSARVAVWREAIEVLVRAGASPREPARQLARCARRGDRHDHAALTMAARVLAICDPEVAEEIGQRALEQLTADVEALLVTDRLDEAITAAADAEAVAERDDRTEAVQGWRQLRGRALLQTGDLAAAATALQGTVTATETEQVRTALDATVVAALGRIAVHRSEPLQARHLARIARRSMPHAGSEVRRHLRWWLSWHALASGDAAEAHTVLTGCREAHIELPAMMVDPSDPVALARIGMAVGDQELADRAVAIAAARTRDHANLSTAAGISAHARGLVAGDPDLLAAACEELDGSPRRVARASAREDLGRTLVEVGDRDRGIEALGLALVAYTAAGAVWDAARTRRRLRDLGVRRRLVASTRSGIGWGALTDAELRVARLVADGLKNREVAERLFVSPHTVSMHLRHAFTKLDINSRVELTRFVDAHVEAA
jgi:DNA-binding CsgD family transcriptional regulator